MPCNDFTLPRAGGSETSASEFPGRVFGSERERRRHAPTPTHEATHTTTPFHPPKNPPPPPPPPPRGGVGRNLALAFFRGGSSDRSAKDAATTLPEGSCLAFDPPARGRVKSVTGRQVET